MNSTNVDDDTSQFNFYSSNIDQEIQRMCLLIEECEKMPLVSLEQAIQPLRHLLPDIQRKVSLAKFFCDTPSDGLISDESASIFLYSMEWKPHDECPHFVLNATLRDRNRQNLKPWLLYLTLLFTALARLPSTRLTVYRGAQENLIEDYPIGSTIVWWDFSLCTSSMDILESELFIGKTGTRTILAIDCYNTKKIGQHSYFNREDDCLLLPATQFHVVACFDQGNGLHIIQLKEIASIVPVIRRISTPSLRLIPTPSYGSNDETITSTTGSEATTFGINIYHNPKLEQRIALCPPESEVYLSYRLTDKDIPIVIELALINKKCARLWLDNNLITSAGISTLASALNNNRTLKELYLHDIRLSDMSVQILARTLELDNCNIYVLSLGRNAITNEGAQYLANMLKKNTTLTHLYLWRNKIRSGGVKYLANALAYHNNTLEVLCLNSNMLISNLCVNSLVNMLRVNESLRELQVCDCYLSRISKFRLQNVAKRKEGFSLQVKE